MADDEGGRDKTDPLSKATRTTKRNLLLASLVAITFRAFDISADKIPFAGMNITYDRGVFEFLLAAVTTYFLLSFVVYYYIDIKNFPGLEHQYTTEKWRADQLKRVVDQISHRIAVFVNELRKGDFYLTLSDDFGNHLKEWIKDTPGVVAIYRRIRAQPYNLETNLQVIRSTQRGSSFAYSHPEGEHRSADEAEAIQRGTGFITEQLNAFPRRYLWVKLRTAPILWTVRAVYVFRNYGLDGLFPVVMALLAMLAIYNIVPLHWLAALAPSR